MSLKAIRGMSDLMPEETLIWQRVEDATRRIFSQYRFAEIRTPIVEPLQLFVRTLGEDAPIVQKEMYAFEDRLGKQLTLRPEGTASVVRAYIEHHLDQADSQARLYYVGPMYRYERPQKGRYRQFHQIGAEVIGSPHPLVDAELIHICDALFRSLGLTDLELEINSLGCPVCRPGYIEKLAAYLEANAHRLCEDCQKRRTKNPMRVLDCKNPHCREIAQEAPSIQDMLCEDCERHFDSVLEGIGHFGSSYSINPNIVRGLDYYQRTSFEFTTERLGSQNAVAGGGRYDGLVRLLGGPHVPGVGFAIGMERLIALLAETPIAQPAGAVITFIAALGDAAIVKAIPIAEHLRAQGLSVELNYEAKGLKQLMRRGDRILADFTVILGSDELEKNQLILRNMKTKEQIEIPLDQLGQLVDIIQGDGGRAAS